LELISSPNDDHSRGGAGPTLRVAREDAIKERKAAPMRMCNVTLVEITEALAGKCPSAIETALGIFLAIMAGGGANAGPEGKEVPRVAFLGFEFINTSPKATSPWPRAIRIRQDASVTTAEPAIAVARDQVIDRVADCPRDEVEDPCPLPARKLARNAQRGFFT
jgi:hypothetical protein